jgi:uncharacterized protein (TIGR02147 family)
MKTIYAYTDYREYISDFLAEKREKNARYSSRCAADKCGVPSGTFTRILNGSRGIGPSLLPKFVTWLGLKHREANYFQLLINFQHCSTTLDRDKYYEELQSYRALVRDLIPAEKFNLFEQWYYIALYELVKITPNISQVEQLGALLDPPISDAKAQKALDALEKAGFIERTAHGFSPVSSFLTTGDTWESASIHAFQRTMCSLGTEALDRFPKIERDVSTLSISLSKENFIKVNEVIRVARQKIKEIEESENAPERVYQINFQVFPLTRKNKNGEQYD